MALGDSFATSGPSRAAISDTWSRRRITSYVTDDAASKALNDLRPNYYDPARPPAASKATVPGVGLDGRTVTLDMIAVVPTDSP
jgi:enamine deaminase RidA (YjgF/YER057c/UK114 family)